MQILEQLLSATGDLVRHKLRTLLTMLGIIFGVGAVISMLSIGAGAQAEALEIIVTLLLAVFCLTFSGQSSDAKDVETNDTFETSTQDFKYIAEIAKKSKRPGQA